MRVNDCLGQSLLNKNCLYSCLEIDMKKTQYTKGDLYTFSAQFYTYINNFWSSLQGGQSHCRRLEGRQRHVIGLRPNYKLTLGAVVQFYLRKKKPVEFYLISAFLP